MAILNQNVEVLTDKPALVERAKEIILERIEQTIAAKDRFTIVLSGGSTPKPLYAALAEESLPWSKIHVFWGDERYVPATDPNSNQLMARQAWLNKVEIPEANIHPMQTDGASPQDDAARHEAELKQFFSTESQFPTFDLILLGMGNDGHTASLFPHTDALSVRDRWVTVGNHHGDPRLTLTVPTIDRASCVIFLVAGEDKRPPLAKVFAPQEDEAEYPARLIQPEGELLWLLDRSAAAEL